MKKKCIPYLIAVGVLFVFLASCATKIPIKVERPPTLNTSGIRNLAIVPFTGSDSQIASVVTTIATDRIREMNYFTLVDATVVNDLRRRGQSFESHADAIFTGNVTRANTRNTTEQGQSRNRDGTVVTYTIYVTEIEVEFTYQLIRARDGSLIGPITKRRTGRSSSRDGYPNAQDMFRSAITRELRGIGNDLAPHTVTERIKLAKDTTKNKAVNEEMKVAEAQVKSGSYKQALDYYLSIYERYKSVAAAENASILFEALGETPNAAGFMQQVFNDTGNPRARDVLARLNKILADMDLIAADYGDQSQIDKLVVFASV